MLRAVQIGRVIPGTMYMKMVAYAIKGNLDCPDLHCFLNAFNGMLEQIKSGTNVKAMHSYRGEMDEHKRVSVWRINCHGMKERIVYSIYEL